MVEHDVSTRQGALPKVFVIDELKLGGTSFKKRIRLPSGAE